MIKSKLSVLVAAIFMTIVFTCPLHAAEYKNAELGFSVSYPDELETQPNPMPTTVLFAIAATKMPWITATVIAGATLTDAFKASFVGASDYTDIEIGAAKDDATDSGIKAQTAPVKYMYGPYKCEGIVLGAQKNGKWILVALATVPQWDSSFNPDAYLRILKTLKFN
jgi:hypothetical protein